MLALDQSKKRIGWLFVIGQWWIDLKAKEIKIKSRSTWADAFLFFSGLQSYSARQFGASITRTTCIYERKTTYSYCALSMYRRVSIIFVISHGTRSRKRLLLKWLHLKHFLWIIYIRFTVLKSNNKTFTIYRTSAYCIELFGHVSS